jgi:hypothetical protein
MRTLARFAVITFALVAIYLIVSRSTVYADVARRASDAFAKLWSSLTTGVTSG